MRIYNPQGSTALQPELETTLAALRRRRGFDVNRYVDAKATVLNDYLGRAGLDSCVVAVSGGLDSATVLALAVEARKRPSSPLKKILAIMLPVFDPGATNQKEAAGRGEETARALGVEPTVIDISPGHAAIKQAVDSALGVTGEPWASGQLVSYVRTPTLYYITSLLTQQGHAGVLLGTTNRDEGGYLGYIGKASDGMVDVQVISDLHKSEVYAVARALGVPQSVLSAVPTGDMFDGRVDEEVFGAPYDFVELYLLYKDLSDAERDSVSRGWSAEAKGQFDFFARNLEDLHRYNRHKYLGKSPAVHLDVMKADTKGGWNNSLYLLHRDPPITPGAINGFFELDVRLVEAMNAAPDPEVKREPLLDLGDSGMVLRNVFSKEEMAALRDDLLTRTWEPVAVDGMRKDFDPAINKTGSGRATAYNPVLAQTIWNRISGSIGNPRVMGEHTPTDWDGTPVWRAVGINPMLRFIRYDEGGLLIPHYDGPFSYHHGKRTLMSVVLYIDAGNGSGGRTRFIRDPQANLPVTKRNLHDWTRFAAEDEVALGVQPEAGACLVFDHRILHDSEEYSGTTPKIILRTDIVFERCATPPRDE